MEGIITKIDESKLDIDKEVGDKEKVKVNLKKEISFARDLHPKSCVGLNVDQQPPDPDVWFGLVDGENYSQKLMENWEHMKTVIIQEIEKKEDLGAAAGLSVSTSAVAIVSEGESKDLIKQLSK